MNPVYQIRCDCETIDISRIVWLEGDWNYTRIYLIDRPVRLSAYTLKKYERELSQFVRISKKAIVNPAYVRLLHSVSGRPGRTWLQLCDGKFIEVSRRRSSTVKGLFKGAGTMRE
ncbi:LytR/AlgR family response regulator transcription factor [Arsenicibacter rosenii]|uniref:HTH LytTR-type domain-containing protein n=1 Tax=Arsenicibacter rosenii TaxID=1750698 RepID=A0A1S2VAQ2_9BACT|nr:LytTR family DNA-binding domain-containing protein [Arsenicibacter rosenii]OIN55490.1 hypothetical protein BLX24_30080 [Arsenicibacter rosenii]